jgi:anti-sigma factor RsiW
MNEEFQLKLQAYLDGELPPAEAAQVEQWLERDVDARALRLELQNTVGALAGQEADVKLPESREFFWSKIEREIGRQSAASVPVPARASFWSRWGWRGLIPAGALALVCVLMLKLAPSGAAEEFSPELEVAADNMGAYTFRNQEDGLTMIWLYDRGPDAKLVRPAAAVTLAAR